MPLPEILNTGFKAEEPKLWSLDIPIEEIPISEIEYNLDIPYLEQEGTDDWNLTPRMLIENFDKEQYHAGIVNACDISYPIDIFFHKDKWIILDGVHRFTKIVMSGGKTIKARKVPSELIPLFKRD